MPGPEPTPRVTLGSGNHARLLASATEVRYDEADGRLVLHDGNGRWATFTGEPASLLMLADRIQDRLHQLRGRRAGYNPDVVAANLKAIDDELAR